MKVPQSRIGEVDIEAAPKSASRFRHAFSDDRILPHISRYEAGRILDLAFICDEQRGPGENSLQFPFVKSWVPDDAPLDGAEIWIDQVSGCHRQLPSILYRMEGDRRRKMSLRLPWRRR